MPPPIMQNLITTMALAIQCLIFIYLYTSYRARFFRYCIYAWGLMTTLKVLTLTSQFWPMVEGLEVWSRTIGILSYGLLLAAGLAFRWQYRLRWWHAVLAIAMALSMALLAGAAVPAMVLWGIHGLSAGGLVVGGLAFWPRAATAAPPRGARLLAVSLILWGLHHLIVGSIHTRPESGVSVGGNATFYLLYFLAVFALIILVLDEARRQAATLQEFNERLVDGLGEGLQLVDGAFRIHHANRWMAQQSGETPRAHCYDAMTHDGQPCPGCPLPGRHQIHTPVRLDVAGAGGRRWRLTCAPVRQPDGQIWLLELVADVTEQERLRARLSEAERLAAVGELAAGLAHEIRNPLAAIVNATTLLEQAETLTTEERTTTLAAMKQEARRLNAVLSDFLAFARPREPRRLPGDIGTVIGHVATLLRDDPVRTAGVQVEVHLDPAVPTFAFDADQLTQVLWNLTLNGVEAMQGQGRLSLDVQRHDDEVWIAVADTGSGIPVTEQGQIFQPFYSRRRGGTGLGLAIARTIVAAHGGRIELESAPEQGSRFTIHLPLAEENGHGSHSHC